MQGLKQKTLDPGSTTYREDGGWGIPGRRRVVHTGKTMVNESGDYGEGKGQNQDLDPGSGAYREDDIL
ncbi:MAG: hypothetical protein GX056_05325 [Synergistaceae bacterium]|nr:hypothetical protein [Synergistaceae bacterium]NLW61812.1 hypothetical protein [Synergistaceae bacterium]